MIYERDLVFVTKYRRVVLTKEMLDALREIIKETCEQMDCELLDFNGEDDHPKITISNLAGKLKSKSSYLLRRKVSRI